MKRKEYRAIKKLGEELGMNVFNTKSFNDGYNKGQKKLKIYTRVCKYCNEFYDIKARKKSRPKGSGVCPECKIKSDDARMKNIKIKSKNKWERLILDILKKGKKLSIKEVAEKAGCSTFPIRRMLKILEKEKIISIFIGPKKKKYLIYNEKHNKKNK